MNQAMRLIVANLDAESGWARTTGLREPALAPAVLVRISILGTLLSVLAPEAESLWTPVPVDPACRREVAGFPHPTLISGPLPTLPPSACLAWAQAAPLPLSEAALAAAAEANHKGAGRHLAQSLDLTLPGTTEVQGVSEALGTEVANGAWIIKAPFSASGRHRVQGLGPDPDAPTRKRLARLFRAHTSLWIEPFVERLADFGQVLDPAGTRSTHQLLTTAKGQVHGLATLAPKALAKAEQTALDLTLTQVHAHLHSPALTQPYRGPLGIDAFRYRTCLGDTRFHPLVEINARHTFGHVFARMRPIADAAFGTEQVAFALRFGSDLTSALPGETRVLVGSPDGSKAYAWLERLAPDGTRGS